MKYLTSLLFVITVGCCNAPHYPKEMIFEVQRNSARMKRYVELMKDGKTSRKQDRKMLEANAKAWEKLEEVVSK